MQQHVTEEVSAPRRNGRPRAAESIRRRNEMLRLIADGVPGDEAVKRARVKPERANAVLAELVRPMLAKAA